MASEKKTEERTFDGTNSSSSWLMSWEVLEEKPIGFFKYVFSLAAIIFTRNVLESFSGTGFTEQAGSYLVHYPLAYIAPLLALSCILSIFSRTPVIKVTRLMLYVWLLTLLPPLVDIFITTGIEGEGTRIGYLSIPEGEYWQTFLNFFNPAVRLEGTTVGIRLEALLASILSLIYVRIKTRSWWRSVAVTFAIFSVSFFFFTFPYVYLAIVKLFDANVKDLTELFLSNGTLIRTDVSRVSMIMAQIDILIVAILLFLWYGLYSGFMGLRQVAVLLFDRSALHAAVMTGTGIIIGSVIILPYEPIVRLFTHHSDSISLLSVILASMSASAAISCLGRERDLETPDGSSFHRNEFIFVFLTFAAITTLTIGFSVFCFLLLYMSALVIREIAPFELRRYPVLSALSYSVGSVALILMSFSLFVGNRVPTFFPKSVLSILLISLSAGFIAIELVRERRQNNRILSSTLLLAAYLVPLFLFRDLPFSVLSITAAVLSSSIILLLKPLWYTGPVFVLYLAIGLGMISRDLREFREPYCGTPQQIRHAELASIFRSEGRIDHARVELEEAVRLGSPDPMVYFDLGFEHARTGNELMAAEMFSKVTELDSTYGEAYYNLALAYSRMGREEEAVRNLVRASRHIQSDNEVKLKTARLLSESGYPAAALSLMFEGLSEASGEQLLVFEITQRALRQPTGEIPDPTTDAGRYITVLYEAVEKSTSGDIDSALDLLNSLEREFPGILTTEYYTAWLIQSSGDIETAVIHYDRILEKIPTFYEAMMNLGVAYMELGRFSESREIFQDILTIKTDDTKALINSANSYSRERKFDESMKFLERALKIDPENYAARINLAIVFEHLKRTDEAIQQYETLIRMNKETPELYSRLSSCFMQKGDSTLAKESLEKAVDLGSKSQLPGRSE